MTENWWLWLLGILVVAVLAFYALRKNFNVELSSGDKKVLFTKRVEATETKEVYLLDEAKLEDVEAGDITGLKEESVEQAGSKSVNVLNKAEIKKAKLGNITGAEIGSGVERKK